MIKCGLSDLEINLNIAKYQYSSAVVIPYVPKPTLLEISGKCKTSSVEVRLNDLCYVINYIEDWRYAGQLIDNEKISLLNDGDKWEAEITYLANTGAHQTEEECSHFYTDENPKRAVAIVYLISKGVNIN